VTVVSEHLDRWADSVPGRVARDQELPGLEKVRQGLRRQTIIWRQLLAGEKEAEAYLDREQRAQLRHELRALALRSYPRFVPALVVGVRALALVAIHFDAIASWYRENVAATGAATLLFSLAGALGITRASVGLTPTPRVADATLTLGEVFPEPSWSPPCGSPSSRLRSVNRQPGTRPSVHRRDATPSRLPA
jgi:hypothetical protein